MAGRIDNDEIEPRTASECIFDRVEGFRVDRKRDSVRVTGICPPHGCLLLRIKVSQPHPQIATCCNSCERPRQRAFANAAFMTDE